MLDSISRQRNLDNLLNELGFINDFLLDPDVNEIMVNPNGKLFLDSATEGLKYVKNCSVHQVQSIINYAVALSGRNLNSVNQRLALDLPVYKHLQGERFVALVPPLVSSPSFTLRKHPGKIFALTDYLESKRLKEQDLLLLSTSLQERKNILICGGPGSGKTTFTNALLQEMIKLDPNQRIITIEEMVPELLCKTDNVVPLLSNEVNMTDCLKTAMQLRPDRIVVGEVKGPEALVMLKAWNTGCPGGLATVHANSAKEAVQRIEDLTLEAGLVSAPHNLIRMVLDLIVFIKRQGSQKGFVQEILTFNL